MLLGQVVVVVVTVEVPIAWTAFTIVRARSARLREYIYGVVFVQQQY